MNKVRIEDLTALIKNVFKAGYEDTIELTINGEYYEVVEWNIKLSGVMGTIIKKRK